MVPRVGTLAVLRPTRTGDAPVSRGPGLKGIEFGQGWPGKLKLLRWETFFCYLFTVRTSSCELFVAAILTGISRERSGFGPN
jgi:hypothetical protein